MQNFTSLKFVRNSIGNNALSTNAVPIQRPASNAEKSHITNHSVSGFKLVSLNINKLTTHIDEIRIF